jgi:hypothetical protein
MTRANRVPVALWGGLIVALLGWRVGMTPPTVGVDASWNAALAIGVHDGLRWGKELVWTYGPLGFLQTQLIWFSGLAVLAFLYSGLIYTVFCVGLVWALGRRLPLLLACLGAFVAVTVLSLLELSLLSAVFACFWLLEPGAERSPRQLDAFVVVAATLAAPAALIKLSTGPLVAVVLLLALLGARVGTRRIVAYLAILLGLLVVLWLASGQSLADVPAFVENTLQISGGYSAAMLRSADIASWKAVAAAVAAVVLTIGLVAAAWFAPYRDRRGRWAGTLIVALAAFAIYKEGVVRVDAGHLTLFFANACILWVAAGFALGRRWWIPALAVVLFVVGLPLRPASAPEHLNPVANLHYAVEQTRNALDSGRREAGIEAAYVGMQEIYELPPQALAKLRGHRVAVEPWEVAAAWAYGLDWQPQPVVQNYSAYTSHLDRLNAEAMESADGPERLLRENPLLVHPEFATADIDNRFFGWDPPEQARAVLCNFVPLYTDERWQVLGRVPDRCGPQRSLGTVEAAAGEAVPVPRPGPNSVVFVRIGGVGVEGLEKVQTFLFHAGSRHLTVNGTTRYRLVPETAGDGLLLRAAPALTGPRSQAVEAGPFDPIPEARTIAADGGSDRVTYSFFETRVRLAHPG